MPLAPCPSPVRGLPVHPAPVPAILLTQTRHYEPDSAQVLFFSLASKTLTSARHN
jgi:hypothetical protein